MKTQMSFNNEIEEVKAQIQVLQKKLSFLEELSQTKTPCEKAFKRVYGYYSNPNESDTTWIDFVNGYKSAQEDYKVGEHQKVKPPETLYDICMDWWDRVFGDTNDTETCIDDLVNSISEWLPKEHDTNSYKWNECIKMIKSKLR